MSTFKKVPINVSPKSTMTKEVDMILSQRETSNGTKVGQYHETLLRQQNKPPTKKINKAIAAGAKQSCKCRGISKPKKVKLFVPKPKWLKMK